MTLAFSTELNGKPTFFVEKIWQSIPDEVAMDRFSDDYLEGLESVGYDFDVDAVSMSPKIHTIRRDSKNRWKAGNDIHFVINNRTPNHFQFAPVVKCVSTQKVEISYHQIKSWDGSIIDDNAPMIRIDGYVLSGSEARKLAINDGFDSVEDFFAYFSEDFKGKIIHWTDLKY